MALFLVIQILIVCLVILSDITQIELKIYKETTVNNAECISKEFNKIQF
jgi:hypothetical protein